MQEDPEEEEIRAVRKHVSFMGRDVLEIGCGHGRVTRKYWNEPRRLIAIDPDKEAVATPSKSLPGALAKNVKLQVGRAEELNVVSDSFDVVFFTWSLCCVQDADRSLREAWRVLRTRGLLLNLMPDPEPSMEVGVIRLLGAKDVTRSFSADAYKALIRSMRDKRFSPLKEERVFFSVYLDSVEEFVNWLPSYTGPFNQQEFSSITQKSIEAMKTFAQSLKWDRRFRVRDVLSLISAQKVS